MAKRWAIEDKVYDTDLREIITHSNLVFADAAARDAFLVGDLAPVPGMLTYLVAADNLSNTQRRIRVGGVDYWAPPTGMEVVGMSPAASVSAATGVATQVVNMTNVRGRNANTMWANNQFTPSVPGFYELDAAVRFNNASAADGYRLAWLSLNGASQVTAIPGSGNQLGPGAANPSTVHTRTVSLYFNGIDGSYVTLMCMHNSASSITISGLATSATLFTAKYLGM